jgi:hypothetical protein
MCSDQVFLQSVSLSHPALDQVTIYCFFKPTLGNYKGSLKGEAPSHLFRLSIGQSDRIRFDRTAISAEKSADLLAGFQPLFIMEFIGQVV